MFVISSALSIPRSQIDISPIRASGPGGQNVNKVSSAVHLRFNVPASSLPKEVKDRLMKSHDRRITSEGVIVIKAQRFRSLEKNTDDALERLKAMVLKASAVRRKRKPTKPSKSSKMKRLNGKTHRGRVKKMRSRVEE